MSEFPDVTARTEIRDGMKITWHQPIAMDDGIVLRADVFAPIAEGAYPAILTYGVYAKGLAYQEGYPHQWKKMVEDHPEILEGSTNKYQNWEVTDPERWVPHGYVVIRVDSRGAGWSPGVMDCNSTREIDDLYQCIEWAGTQPWCNGKVGMLGISYYASNQWRVAGLHPPHLAAIIPWEGQNDRYRDSGYHGGILSEFQKLWAKHQVVNIQYGLGARAKKNPNTGESVAGRVTLNVRHPGEKFVLRHEHEWPLARTKWTKLYLDVAGRALSPKAIDTPAKIPYEADGPGVLFSMTLDRPTEITGPLAAKLFISSSTRDADLFLVLRVFDPGGKELTFMGSTDPNTPIANGWLRASHRRLDPKKSKPWQPYHPHDRVEPLAPGDVYECDVEILPTSIVLPAGWRVALNVRGRDYEYEGELSEFGKTFHYGTRGTGGMTHADPDSRPAAIFDNRVTIHSGGTAVRIGVGHAA